MSYELQVLLGILGGNILYYFYKIVTHIQSSDCGPFKLRMRKDTSGSDSPPTLQVNVV
jgi:hypothetical protein